ncbi:hypothetical protein TNCV_727461 [Trichonephila clavipes]|nr:hypothetical protein TNCV_727461 [Trichonephila clavipes]
MKKKIQRTESDSPRKPKSRRARQRDLKPHLTRIPKKLSRDFHRKIEEDTLTGDCSKTMKISWIFNRALRLLAPEEERVRHIHDLLHFLELPWFED